MAYKKKTILLYQLVGQLSLSLSLRLWAPTQPSYHWKSQVPQWEGRASNHPHYHCKNLQQMGEQAVTVRPTFPTLPTFTTTRPTTLNHGHRLHWWKNQSRTLLYLIMVSECLHSFGGFSSHRLPKEPWVGFNFFFFLFFFDLHHCEWDWWVQSWKGNLWFLWKFFDLLLWFERKEKCVLTQNFFCYLTDLIELTWNLSLVNQARRFSVEFVYRIIYGIKLIAVSVEVDMTDIFNPAWN